MGVDYYACQNCGRTFPDCGNYFSCYTCDSRYCSDECGGKEYVPEDPGEEEEEEKDWEVATTCILCRRETIRDSDLVSFLCQKLNLTYDQAADLYRKENKVEDE